MQTYERLYIDGGWQDTASGASFAVENPAREVICGEVPEGGVADVDTAVAAARHAWPAWRNTAPVDRATWLLKIHDALAARRDEIAACISEEVGMPLKMSQRVQLGNPLTSLKTFADLAANWPADESIGHSRVRREPVGVVACITPWNFPLHQIMAKLAAALAAGCTVIVKPSEIAPRNAFLLAEVIDSVGLPAGVFNLVSGYGPVAGEALVRHAGVDAISFTGSTRAGKRVAALAAETVKRVSLELGGKSASLVLEDADLELAVKSTVALCLFNSGQTCSALTRLLVPRALHQQAAELAARAAAGFTLGDPFDAGSKLGPLVSAAQRERVLAFIAGASAEGAQQMCGGVDRPAHLRFGHYVQPTVFADVSPDSRLAQEEVFGPVLAIIPYADEAEAIAIANGTPYGLAAAVWSHDVAHALAVARELRAGQVDINGAPFNPLAPFGGFKQSGIGRELGAHGLAEFQELQSIQVRS